ncbi:hypothetical protein HDU67_008437 [Dinochytrium kinnereticum]|nr:hypothetical protein HDU67_008437 [Dinochytrium kinnereticum]
MATEEPTTNSVKPFFQRCQKALDETVRAQMTLPFLTAGSASSINDPAVTDEAGMKELEIFQLIRKVGKETKGQDFHRHFKSFAPGLEEYVEAATFLHYLKTGEIVH